MKRLTSLVGGATVQALREGRVIRQDFWPLLILISSLTLRIASEATANASFFLLAAYAFFGRSQVIQAMALSWLFSVFSGGAKGGIAPLASQAAIGRYAVVFAAALSICMRSILTSGMGRVSLPIITTLLFGVFIFFHSCLMSTVVEVSVLKATVWMVALLTLLSAWEGLSVERRRRLHTQLIWLLMAILLCSFPLLFLPLGYLTNGTGFQGVLNQPQGFGPTMAVLSTFVIIGFLAKHQPQWRDFPLVLACLVMVVMSHARTAGLALVLGVATTAILAPMLMRQSSASALPGLRHTKTLLMLLSLSLCALAGLALGGEEKLSNVLESFLSKGGESSNLSTVYENSRGGLIHGMLDNIVATPWSGIGFGVASNPWNMEVERDPNLGLPTGASIEKGVMPIAVLEEIGIPGFLFFLVWLWLLIQRAGRQGIMELAAVMVVLFINLGESTLFSTSGYGMINLIVLSWAVTMPRQPSSLRFHA